MRRLDLTLLIALALAGCGKDSDKAFLDSRTPPSLGPRFWKPDGWAWGVIRIEGAPEIRYGVAVPANNPGGKVMVIATGYGESAEVYYETVRDLNARGWSVWVIEPHGQGGSGRFPGARDVGRSAGFDKDAAAIRWLVENVIRPSQDDQVVLAAHGTGAIAALWAAEDGLPRMDRLYLWDPDFDIPAAAKDAQTWNRFGMGGMRASGAAWHRPTVNLTWRTTLPLAWQVANPDLRMGGPGWSWIKAKTDAVKRVTAFKAVWRIRARLDMDFEPNITAANVFNAGHCGVTTVRELARPDRISPLSGDRGRGVWLLAATDTFDIAPNEEPVCSTGPAPGLSDHAR